MGMYADAGLMRPGSTLTLPLLTQVSLGNVPYMSKINKFGRNADLASSGTSEDLWDVGGLWVQPTQARIHNIASVGANAAEDTLTTGDGAWTVEINGLGDGYALQSETVNMNGPNSVATVNSYIMIHRMIVRSAGVTGSNEGAIKATAVTDATITAQITIGDNQTLMAIYQVPAGKSALLLGYYHCINSAVKTAGVDMSLLIKPFGEVFQCKHRTGAQGAGSSYVNLPFNVPLALTEKTLIKLQGVSDTNSTDVSGGFDLLLIDDDS